MKTKQLFIAAVFIFLFSFSFFREGNTLVAQSLSVNSVVNAPDFTITTTDGVSRNLYTTLAQGKAIVLDFFFLTCPYCIQYAPMIEQVYQSHGAGTQNFDIWGIESKGGSNSGTIGYKSSHNVYSGRDKFPRFMMEIYCW